MQDNEIIALFWKRDEVAIKRTAHKYGSYCFVIASNILGNQEDADECVNDTWLGAWRSMPPNRPNVLSTFLGRITRNLSFNKSKARNALKRGGGEIPLVLDELIECVPSDMDVERAVDDIELGRCINQFLYTLPNRECNVFIRRYWYVEPLSAIAKRYDMNENSVKASLYRTRQKLKSFLQKEGIVL